MWEVQNYKALIECFAKASFNIYTDYYNLDADVRLLIVPAKHFNVFLILLQEVLVVLVATVDSLSASEVKELSRWMRLFFISLYAIVYYGLLSFYLEALDLLVNIYLASMVILREGLISDYDYTSSLRRGLLLSYLTLLFLSSRQVTSQMLESTSKIRGWFCYLFWVLVCI